MIGRLATYALAFVVGLAALWWAYGIAGEDSRALAYNVAVPNGWPVTHETRFNGAQMDPKTHRTDTGMNPVSFGGGLQVIGSVPAKGDDATDLTVTSAWREWATGASYRAEMTVAHGADEGALILFFEAGGALSLHRPSKALRDGTLGRAARLSDYVEVGRTCGTALAATDAAVETLDQAQERARTTQPHLPLAPPYAAPGPSPCEGE